MIAEVARNKALAVVLGKAKVVDGKGKAVDLTDFTATDDSGEDFVEAIAPQGRAGGAKDSHGRAPGHEHYGHDHK
jgi:trigger factor